MRDSVEVMRASDYARASGPARVARWLAEPAPEFDLPDARDKAGAQGGMLITLIAGAGSWLAVAALVLHLAR